MEVAHHICAGFHRAWPGLIASLLLAGASGGLTAAEEPRPAGSTGEALEIVLGFREIDNSAVTSSLTYRKQATPFKKEPALGQQKVTRGFLTFGKDAAQELPFICDQDKKTLYLDQNRNQDFTDDPQGEYHDTTRQASSSHQAFTGVRLRFTFGGADQLVLADLNWFQFGDTYLSISAVCRSLWEGKLVLNGNDWQIGLVPNLSGEAGPPERGYLLLRPWSARSQPFALTGSAECISWPKHLFFSGSAFELRCAYTADGGQQRYNLAMKPERVELGELRLTGKFIDGLVLFGSPYTVILAAPASVAKVPTGQYVSYRVSLKAGAGEAYLESRNYAPTAGAAASLKVASTGQSSLDAGGPLTNTVTAARHGRNLNLTYRLLGAGGQEFQLKGERKQPEFVAYRGGQKVGSGKFEFG